MVSNMAKLTHPNPEFGYAMIDMNDWATCLTLDVIAIAALGRDLGIIQKPNNPLKSAYDEAFRESPRKAAMFFLAYCRMEWIMDYVPWNLDSRDRAATLFLRKFCRDAIQDKRRSLHSTPATTDTKAPDLLSKLIASETLTDDQLVEQLLSILAAGHETVAATFSWSIYLLATHQSIQDRLRAEIRSSVDVTEMDIEDEKMAELLRSLPLLNAVCAETIRIYPSVPLTPRVAVRDTSILDTFVPKNTSIMIAPGALNRSSRLWGSVANKFTPDQWINHDTGTFSSHGYSKSTYSMSTFLHGKRGCIGSEYAKAELRSMVAAMVCCFKMELQDPDEPVIPTGKIVARPCAKNGTSTVKIEHV
ncbi:unnamed protein product [Penicillium salamii]|nr:unnamed protein product [Penicillium salamii]CAG8204597.1 unnamed protein product [Penicillium salamii]CAG8428803.1 unnamed protein product [Penicillium salamii]